MIDKGKLNILGVHIDAVDYAAAIDKVISAAKARRGLSVTALAVHGVMTGVLDATQRYRLNHLDLVVPDGQPVRWALNWLYQTRLINRVYGPTLMLRICEQAAMEHVPIYLFGSQLSVLEPLSANLRERCPGLTIAGMRPSKFGHLSTQEKEELITAIMGSGAAITFVGLGCPRQETWVYEFRDSLHMPLLAVGAAFDFHAGTLPQAPERLQNIGLEWLYRLAREPKRLWRRYVFLNPLYVGLLILQATGLREFDPSKAIRPAREMRYG